MEIEHQLGSNSLTFLLHSEARSSVLFEVEGEAGGCNLEREQQVFLEAR